MKQQRSSYLVTKSLKQYLVASVIAMAVFNLNTMLDGILMGNFLGPEALAAINLCMPVVNVITTLSVLLSAGGVLIAANALGEMDRNRMYEVFTISSFAQWILGLVLLLVSGPLSSMLGRLVNNGGELAPLCEKYIRVLLIGSAVLMYANGFSSFLNVCGYPQAISVIMSLSVVVNILLDVLLVRVIGMDISGAAWASVAGNLVSVIGLIVFTLHKKNMLKLTFSVKKPLSQLGKIIARSVAQTISALAITALEVICNIFVQNALGTDGMFVLSIGYSILGVSSMVAGGMSGAFTAIGGTMAGQKDYQGVRYLYRRGMLISLLTGLLFLLIALLIPRPLAGLFGANTEALQTLASYGIPLICTFIIAITLLMPCSAHFQVIGRFALSSVVNLSLIASILISCLVVSNAFPKEKIWLAFPLAGILCLLTLAGGICITKLSAGKKISFPELVPAEETEVRTFDMSVPCTQEAFENGMQDLWDWLHESQHSGMGPRIAHCVEEMLLNTIQHSGRNASHDIDVLLRESTDEVTALLKDDGVPFNTSACLTENRTYGLKLAHHFCPNIEYTYSFGQNMTLMKWPVKTAAKRKENQ